MKNSTKLILTLLAFGEGLLAVILFRLLSGSPVLLKYLVVCAVIALAVGVDWFVMRSGSAESERAPADGPLSSRCHVSQPNLSPAALSAESG